MVSSIGGPEWSASWRGGLGRFSFSEKSQEILRVLEHPVLRVNFVFVLRIDQVGRRTYRQIHLVYCLGSN